jgi:hypothetical protein
MKKKKHDEQRRKGVLTCFEGLLEVRGVEHVMEVKKRLANEVVLRVTQDRRDSAKITIVCLHE